MNKETSLIPVLEMRHITKRFGSLTANDRISLTLNRGEVHAILGENGAGKTTLMKVLYGEYHPNEGEILMGGEKVRIDSPADAIKKGIGMVYQHFRLVETLTVLENLLLGQEKTWFGFLSKREQRAELQQIIDRYSFDINLEARVSDISIGMQQRVEILKTIYHGAQIVILDEPTAVLTPQEILGLAEIIRRLTAEGKSLILITHKLHEIKEMADRCTVIRRGVVMDTVDVKTVTEKDLAFAMVGRVVSFDFPLPKTKSDETLLDIQNITIQQGNRIPKLRNLSLTLKRGEILGIAGVDGNGQRELIEALVGVTPYTGNIQFNRHSLKGKTPRQIFDLGLSSIPQDRHKEGLIVDYDMKQNLALRSFMKAPYSQNGILNDKAMLENAVAMQEAFDIRPRNPSLKVGNFSGGNQQKIIIAREVSSQPEMLLAAHPTRGLDVGAIQYIYEALMRERDNGKGILLVSFELEELMSICDRIAVIFHGEIVGIVSREEATEEMIGLMMMGEQPKREKQA